MVAVEDLCMGYTAPIADIRFALEGAADFWSLRHDGRFSDLDQELLAAILDGANALASETLAPLNKTGDQTGVTLSNDEVRTPPGFREAYEALKSAGWQGLAADPTYGGQGFVGEQAAAGSGSE